MTMKILAQSKFTRTRYPGPTRGAIRRRFERDQLVASMDIESSSHAEGLDPFPKLSESEVRDALRSAGTFRQAMSNLGLWAPDAYGSAVPFLGTAGMAIDLLEAMASNGKTFSFPAGAAGVTIRAIPGKDGRAFVAPIVVATFEREGLPAIVAVEARAGQEVRHIPGSVRSLSEKAVLELLAGEIYSDAEAFPAPETWSDPDRERTFALLRDATLLLPDSREALMRGERISAFLHSRTARTAAAGRLNFRAPGRLSAMLKEPGPTEHVVSAIARHSGFAGQKASGNRHDEAMPHWSPGTLMEAYTRNERLFEESDSSTLRAARIARAMRDGGGTAGARERLLAFLSEREPEAAGILREIPA